MNILIGSVISNHDETKTGLLMVKIPDLSDNPLNVVMTSPFYTLNSGGMLAIPEVGSKVLVSQDTSTGKLYYLSTIIEPPENEQVGGLVNFNVLGDKYIYTERGRPQKVTYANQFNAGLHIDRRLLPEYMASKVSLVSESGKKISLSDSPKSDAVIIRNEHGDGMIITSDPSDVHSERSIEVKSKGSQRHVVFQGGMEMYVIDGKDITIENFSTGAYANENATGRFGNITLRSENSDINIVSKANDGRIFILTPKARIQIENDGTVKITSDADIQINCENDIDIKAGKALRIQGESIDIKATNDVRVQAGGNSSILATGSNSLDGDRVDLNSGVSLPSNEAIIADPITNDYGE